MSDWLYTLRERFTPASPDRWCSYQSFSGFAHIAELVILDSIMCPDLVGELRDEDWSFNIHEDFRTELFRDADYLLARQPLDHSQHELNCRQAARGFAKPDACRICHVNRANPVGVARLQQSST